MRIAVLVLGILGALSSGLNGFLWWTAFDSGEFKMLSKMASAIRDDVVTSPNPMSKRQQEEAQRFDEAIGKLNRANEAMYFLFAAAAFGLIGGLIALDGRGIAAAALMLCGAIGPIALCLAVDFELAKRPLIMTSPLMLGGVLAFFVWPRDPSKKHPPRRPSRPPRDE